MDDSVFTEHAYAILFFLFLAAFVVYPMWEFMIGTRKYSIPPTSNQPFRMINIAYFLWNSASLEGYPAVDQSAFFISNPENNAITPFLPLLLLCSPTFFLKAGAVDRAGRLCGYLVLGKRLKWSMRKAVSFQFCSFSPIIIQHVAIWVSAMGEPVSFSLAVVFPGGMTIPSGVDRERDGAGGDFITGWLASFRVAGLFQHILYSIAGAHAQARGV